MSSRFPELMCASALTVGATLAWLPTAHAEDEPRQLRVCGDPDNLPYSDEHEAGFENRIARLVASDMHAELRYHWLPQRRGYVRKTMGADLCDVFIGVPDGFERVLTTQPYYRSSYVFVYRKGDKPLISFDDKRIRTEHIGVQLVGNDLAATPPGYALARAGATGNVTGYTVFGNGPASARMVHDLTAHRIDAALIWGPQAGYFVKHTQVPLEMTIAHAPDGLQVPFEFSVSMGVKHGNAALRDELNAVIERRRADIDAILAEYAVPRTDLPVKEAQ